jgi:DNA ligase-1
MIFADAIITATDLKGAGSKQAKAKVLSGLDEAGKKLLWHTYHPYRVYNVRKYDEPEAYALTDTSADVFMNLLDALHARSVVGNAAKAAVTATLGLYTERTASVLKKVIGRDLKCGASRDTFEEIYPDLDIPRFDLMLAAKIEEIAEETAASRKAKKVVLTPEILAKKYGLTFPMIAESKYDGNRLVTMVENGVVEYLARSGRPSDHIIGQFDDELIKLEAAVGHPIMVDGEVLAGSFTETQNAKSGSNKDAKSNLKFFVFDMMSIDEWKAQDCKIVQEQRSATLEYIVSQLGLTRVIKSKYRVVNSISELRDFYGEVLAEGVDAEGNLNGLGEGLIIKNRLGLYEWERSKNWYKWKPVIDLDLKLVGYMYGERGTRLERTVGRLLLDGHDENGTRVTARSGSGLKDPDRAMFLEMLAPICDKVPTSDPNVFFYMIRRAEDPKLTIKIEAQEITLAKNASVHSARFPVFKGIRYDKPIEKFDYAF